MSETEKKKTNTHKYINPCTGGPGPNAYDPTKSNSVDPWEPKYLGYGVWEYPEYSPDSPDNLYYSPKAQWEPLMQQLGDLDKDPALIIEMSSRYQAIQMMEQLAKKEHFFSMKYNFDVRQTGDFITCMGTTYQMYSPFDDIPSQGFFDGSAIFFNTVCGLIVGVSCIVVGVALVGPTGGASLGLSVKGATVIGTGMIVSGVGTTVFTATESINNVQNQKATDPARFAELLFYKGVTGFLGGAGGTASSLASSQAVKALIAIGSGSAADSVYSMIEQNIKNKYNIYGEASVMDQQYYVDMILQNIMYNTLNYGLGKGLDNKMKNNYFDLNKSGKNAMAPNFLDGKDFNAFGGKEKVAELFSSNAKIKNGILNGTYPNPMSLPADQRKQLIQRLPDLAADGSFGNIYGTQTAIIVGSLPSNVIPGGKSIADNNKSTDVDLEELVAAGIADKSTSIYGSEKSTVFQENSKKNGDYENTMNKVNDKISK